MNMQQTRLLVGIGVIFFAIALVLIGDAGIGRWVIGGVLLAIGGGMMLKN